MNPLNRATAQWVHVPGDDRGADLHRWMLGKMAGVHRRMCGFWTDFDWCQIAGISLGQLDAAETGRAMSLATAEKLLAATGLERAPFTRAVMEPRLTDPGAMEAAYRKGRVALVNELHDLVAGSAVVACDGAKGTSPQVTS